MSTSRRRAISEIVAVVLTGRVILVFENVLHLKLHFLVVCIAGWALYIGIRVARDRRVLRDWGLRRDTLVGSAAACGIFFVVAAIGMFSWRLLRGGLLFPPSMALLMLVYPVWGLMQQFFVQSLVAGNLERLGSARAVTIPVAALLFGLAHARDVPLMLEHLKTEAEYDEARTQVMVTGERIGVRFE